MSSVIETVDNSVDPQQEVKKLQNLVKKLERQNEALRSRHNKTMSSLSETSKSEQENRTPSPSPRIDLQLQQTPTEVTPPDNNIDSSPEKMLIDEVDIVDVYNERDEKDDSWLYVSPKKLLPSQSKVSPYKWVRQEFEQSDRDISTGRKSLLFKIDEVSSPTRSGNLTFRSMKSPNKSNNNSSLLSNGGSPSLRQSLINPAIQGAYIDTGTFTRTKKKNKMAYSSSDYDDSREVSPEDVAQAGDENKAHNVLDIQALARAQEESLRQSYSPVASPRRSSLRAHKNSTGVVPPLALTDADGSSPLSSNRSSPGRFDDSTYDPRLTRRLSKSKNSVASGSSHSSGSSPPESPYGSQYLDHNSRDSGRTNGMRHVDSDSKLSPRRNLGGLRPNNSTGNLNPKMSPGRPTSPALKSIGNTSPRRSASPAGRSSIPRPGNSRGSGIPSPRRSAIPSPARASRTRQSDESWKEGCY